MISISRTPIWATNSAFRLMIDRTVYAADRYQRPRARAMTSCSSARGGAGRETRMWHAKVSRYCLSHARCSPSRRPPRGEALRCPPVLRTADPLGSSSERTGKNGGEIQDVYTGIP